MEKNEIEEALYKQKPEAKLLFIESETVFYSTFIEGLDKDSIRIIFEIPINEIGNSRFLSTMEAKLLIRWIAEN